MCMLVCCYVFNISKMATDEDDDDDDGDDADNDAYTNDYSRCRERNWLT